MGDWKAIRIKMGKIQLYNLAEDIGEQNDLADKNPDMVAKMEKLFETARTPSEQFPLVRGAKKKVALSKYKSIPKDNWKLVSADSESKFNGKIAKNAFDNDVNTWWTQSSKTTDQPTPTK
jgi:hypothetical protein